MKQKAIPVLSIVAVASIFIMLSILIVSERSKTAAFVPPQFDSAAVIGVPDVPGGYGYTELDAHTYKVSVCGELTNNDGCVDLYLTNPGQNDVWLKVRILDENNKVIGESGLIQPGEYVKSVTVSDFEKNHAVRLKIMAYEPNTYYSAGSILLNTILE